MMPPVARRLPWRPDDSRLAMRGRALIRLKDNRDHVPTAGDVAIGAALAATRLDDGAVDRRIRALSPGMQVTRAFHAARNVDVPGQRHRGFDDVEESLGLSRTYRVEVAPDTSILRLISDLQALDAVEMASPYYLCECPFAAAGAAPPGPAADWAHRMIGAVEAMAMEEGDDSLIIAVVDSGVAHDHPELSGRCRPGADLVDLPAASVSRGVTLFGDHSQRDRRPYDEMGHGTACASIIGARGLGMPRGLAGVARLLPIRALAGAMMTDRTQPTALGGIPDIDAAVKYAVDLGARVLNLSFGTPDSALRDGDPTPHVEVTRYAIARNCVLVAASGNSGDDTVYFPAALPGVIAVAAVDAAGLPTRFSTRGDHVALAAPGVGIRAAVLHGGYEPMTGTSFAAPFVAAAAGLLVAHATRRSVPLSPFAVRDLLVRSARPFAAGTQAHGCGAGVLDVPAALRAAAAQLDQLDEEVGDSLAVSPSTDRPASFVNA
jgi:subtilase family protein